MPINLELVNKGSSVFVNDNNIMTNSYDCGK